MSKIVKNSVWLNMCPLRPFKNIAKSGNKKVIEEN